MTASRLGADRGEGEAQLAALLRDIRACRVCADAFPHAPRPVVQAAPTARLAIVGQAPGVRVHASGRPFTDPSGERLRAWMGVDEATFYDAGRVAIAPMGFCFPGLDAKGGDLPPRKECAPLWHALLFAQLAQVRLVVLVGGYAQRRYLGPGTLTERVRRWREAGPRYFPTPHPSWRNNAWLKKNPWFEAEALPELRRRVCDALSDVG